MPKAQRKPWSSNSDVRSAFDEWIKAQAAVESLRPPSPPQDLDDVDSKLRIAQQRALSAWHMYEAEREAAGGPHAGIV